jgi:hypothetical protein
MQPFLPTRRTKPSTISILFFTILLLTNTQFSFSQSSLPAFPGAEGFGSTAVGGRGGTVIFVTNLNDNGPGSFRNACLASGPRIIIFRVAGTIFLQSAIVVEEPYLTIAGQTAPGGGICIANEALRIKTHDVIIRGIRSRAGDLTRFQHPLEIEALHIIGDADDNQVYNVIIDHCSMSWAIDKNIGCWADPAEFGQAVHDVTIQWSVSSEGLNSPFHPESDHHSYGMFFASIRNASAHHNLLVHNHARQPQFSRDSEGEAINNVVYNYGQFATEVQSGARVSLIGNYYKTGNDWSGSSLGINVGDYEPQFGNVSVYVSGNIGPGRPTDQGDDWNAVSGNEDFRSLTPPVPLSGVTALPATEAYDLVLANAGAFPRDAVDLRIVADVINNTGQGIESQADVGGWPVLAPGTLPLDTDNDGMTDVWEIANGLNPNSSSDGNGDLDGDGYTNVEEYINSLIADPIGNTGEPPVVSDIPNQSVVSPARFTAFSVDTYVSDPDNSDSEITWTWTGNSSLTVSWDPVTRKIKVRPPAGWIGSEKITFTATDPDGNSDSDPARFIITSAESPQSPDEQKKEKVEEVEGQPSDGIVPTSTALGDNYPNPFNPSTRIRYRLHADMKVVIKLYDVLGREVRTLVDGFVPAGYHEVTVDGNDLVSGMYFYRLTTDTFSDMKKMLLVK